MAVQKFRQKLTNLNAPRYCSAAISEEIFLVFQCPDMIPSSLTQADQTQAHHSRQSHGKNSPVSKIFRAFTIWKSDKF